MCAKRAKRLKVREAASERSNLARARVPQRGALKLRPAKGRRIGAASKARSLSGAAGEVLHGLLARLSSQLPAGAAGSPSQPCPSEGLASKRSGSPHRGAVRTSDSRVRPCLARIFARTLQGKDERGKGRDSSPFEKRAAGLASAPAGPAAEKPPLRNPHWPSQFAAVLRQNQETGIGVLTVLGARASAPCR